MRELTSEKPQFEANYFAVTVEHYSGAFIHKDTGEGCRVGGRPDIPLHKEDR